MASTRELKRRIKGVKKTQQITRAMKMVATVRFKKAQDSIIQARPYSAKIEELMNRLSLVSYSHPLLEERESKRYMLVVISSDKGLCGSFNSNLFRRVRNILKENSGKEITLVTVGKKAKDFFTRHKWLIKTSHVNIFSKLNYAEANKITEELMGIFINNECDEIFMVYNSFKNTMQSVVAYKKLLPVKMKENTAEHSQEYIYEPSPQALINNILPHYVKTVVYTALLDSNASEQGIRMTMMEQATDNADDLIKELTLLMNKARQAGITRELAEISTSAEALKG